MLKKIFILVFTASLCAQTGFAVDEHILNQGSEEVGEERPLVALYYPNLNDAMKRQGYLEIANDQFLRNDYRRLYESYDNFIEAMNNKENLAVILQSEREFLQKTEQAERYCSAPPSFRDPAIHTKKINNRIYFQFIREHYDSLYKNHSELFLENSNLKIFFETLSEVDKMAKQYFERILDVLEQEYPNIKSTVYGQHHELTIITKVVRYDQADNWRDKPHFDKSALTLIWDSDDANHDSLMLCPDTREPSRDKLKLPERLYGNRCDVSSTLLINGLCLDIVGYDLKPTLHYVGPIKQKRRHSLISFLLIPNIDTKNLKTEFSEK